ncbi:MAG: SH3 domain-containing protein [Oscillospiraceae bacterium]|nr:SH3 domain-containing protein [Oscillospiraceae bacterium]
MKYAKKLVLIITIISAVASMLAVSGSAANTIAYGAATVSTQDLRLRSGAGTSYSIITHLSEGDIVVVLDRTNSEWYKVNFHGSTGYVSAPLLKDILTRENFNARGRLIGDRVNIRSSPRTASNILGTYRKGTELTVIGINNGWYKVKHDGHTGYIRSDFVDIIGGYQAAVASSTRVSPTAPAPNPNLTLGQQMVEFALAFVGCDYIYGGTSPTGFDCSGLVTYVYKSFGMSVTRTASGQYRDNGVHINKSELAPGDLVFFSNNGLKSVTHVGIYIGDDEFVHASRPGVGVVISRLDSSYYTKGFFGAKRIITQ